MGLTPYSDLDTIATELVGLYRHAVRNSTGDDAISAAMSLGRALDAIQRVKRSLHPERAYETALSDIADARQAMARLGAAPSEGPPADRA